MKVLGPLVSSLRRFGDRRAPKKFYKDVSVVSSSEDGDAYEICLDQRKLRTPKKLVLSIPSLPLAHAIAKEWDMQKEFIQVGRMHLFGLATTATDNPNNLTSEDIVNRLVDSLLPSDTILYYGEDERLRERQERVWGEFLAWAKKTHGIDIRPSLSMDLPDIPQKTRDALRAHLNAYNFWALTGYTFGAEAMKSAMLMWGTVQGRLSVSEAVQSTLLEVDFQKEQWGNVEWAHDQELHELCARLAAAALFVTLNSAAQSSKKTLRAAQ